MTRLGVAIQKIAILPAIAQNMSNPVPDIPLPDWLRRDQTMKGRQSKLNFETITRPLKVLDLEEPLTVINPPCIHGVASISEFVAKARSSWQEMICGLKLSDQLVIRTTYKFKLANGKTGILLDLNPIRNKTGWFMATIRYHSSYTTARIAFELRRVVRYQTSEIKTETIKEYVINSGMDPDEIIFGTEIGLDDRVFTTVSLPQSTFLKIQKYFLDGTFVEDPNCPVFGILLPSCYVALVELSE